VSGERIRAARQARRRLVVAGWLLAGDGILIALAADLLAPFFFPFGLAVGVLTVLGGTQLARLRGPLSAILAAAATIASGLACLQAWIGHHPAGALAAALGLVLALSGMACLGVLWLDADHLPSGPVERSD
jgi:hypothetical protein